jgi:hypothetical protein
MKTRIFTTVSIATLLLTVAAFSGQAQTAGGASGGAAARPVPVNPAISAPAPGTPGSRQLLQNGQTTINGQGRVQPGLTSQSTTTTTTNTTVGATNGFSGTNTTADTGTNGASVTASVNPMTNGIANSNIDINGNVVLRDQAVTPSDKILLTTLSQGVVATLGITPNGNSPVHFMINNGTVTVVGTVQSSDQSQRVISQVQQTPGVLSVINDLHVAAATTFQNQNAASSAFTRLNDRAFSPTDQSLLTIVQQQAATQLGINSTTQMPVHFFIQNGVVGVTGQVSSQQEKQALIASLARTRGVVRVVDNIGVTSAGVATSGSSPTAIGLQTPSLVNSNLPATSRDPNQPNNVFVNTNSSGF